MKSASLRALAVVLMVGALLAAPPVAAAAVDPLADRGWAWPATPPEVLRPFVAPANAYGPGHRGVDLRAEAVRSPAAGRVAFVGMVAGRSLLTIDHGDGLVTTLEPVDTDLTVGTVVARAGPVGRVSVEGHAGAGVVHFGVRWNGEYVNPLRLLGGVPRAVLLPCCRPVSESGQPIWLPRPSTVTAPTPPVARTTLSWPRTVTDEIAPPAVIAARSPLTSTLPIAPAEFTEPSLPCRTSVSMAVASTRARSPEIRRVPMRAEDASTVRAEPDTVSSAHVPVTRNVCSAPDTVWLPPSPHERAPSSEPVAGAEGVAEVAGAGDTVTIDGDGAATVGEALDADSPGGSRVSTG